MKSHECSEWNATMLTSDDREASVHAKISKIASSAELCNRNIGSTFLRPATWNSARLLTELSG